MDPRASDRDARQRARSASLSANEQPGRDQAGKQKHGLVIAIHEQSIGDARVGLAERRSPGGIAKGELHHAKHRAERSQQDKYAEQEQAAALSCAGRRQCHGERNDQGGCETACRRLIKGQRTPVMGDTGKRSNCIGCVPADGHEARRKRNGNNQEKGKDSKEQENRQSNGRRKPSRPCLTPYQRQDNSKANRFD